MRRLIDRWGLREPILDLAASGAPILGTCAGMIVLARELVDDETPILPLLDVAVRRNAFGRQLDSFETDLVVPVLGDRPVHAVFIRAPIVEAVGPDVDVLARLDDGRVVAVRERNILATAFHPELAGETRFHRLVATMASEHADPGEGAGRRRHPTRRAAARSRWKSANEQGKVRVARLTDLAAMGELSRLCQEKSAETRSLGLPVNAARIGLFSLFRMPLGAFRPHDLLYVYEEDGRIAGLLRAEREGHRDEWTVVELDGVGLRRPATSGSGSIQQLLRDGARGGVGRFHVSAPTRTATSSSSCRPDSPATARSGSCSARPASSCPTPWERRAVPRRRHPRGHAGRRAGDASALHRGDPAPVQRLELVRPIDWERQGHQWRVPRSSLAPILRFADVEAFVRATEDGDGGRVDAFLQVGVAKEEQPHYLKVVADPAGDASDLIDFGLGVIAERTGTPARTDPRRHRARPDLRFAGRSALRGGGVRGDRHRHADAQGDPRPRRRAGPGAGRRPLVEDLVGPDARHRESIDDLDALLGTLPPEIVDAVHALPDREALIEVVLDLGRPPEARFPDREVMLLEREVQESDIAHVVDHIGTFGEDNRAGIERTLHRISAIRNRNGKIVGLTCRIGRAVFGTIEIVEDLVESGKSILIMGRPGIGKTTMLREAARVLADDFRKRVVVVDTSNEIAGDGDIPHPAIGKARRMQVRTPALQHEVMIEAVENHMPQVIVIDEIGTELEAQAARTIAERGVQLIGTAHGNNLDNLMLNPTLSDLIGGIQSVTLGDEEARRRRTQKSVLERKAPPTFDVVVEIQDRDRVIVHADVADTVDGLLRGEPLSPEQRWRDEEGVHRSQARPRPSPREQLGGRTIRRPGRRARLADRTRLAGHHPLPGRVGLRRRAWQPTRLPTGRRPAAGDRPGATVTGRPAAAARRRPAPRPTLPSSPGGSRTVDPWSGPTARRPPTSGPATPASSSASRPGARRRPGR